MEDKISDKESLSPLSASKIKTFENCSWLYWANYILKLPQLKNEGAKKGEICHWIFELLINNKHIDHYNKIIKQDSIVGSLAVERLVKFYIKKVALENTQANLLQIDKMILVGLKNDFFIKDGVLVAPEFKFDLLNEIKGFRIKGFMDKPFIVGGRIIIDDYKSSKKKYEGEEQESNVQALIYSYAAKQIWPNLKPTVRFIFLQYPENPIMETDFKDDVLKGFELYLSETQEKINNFTKKDAISYFAADRSTPEGEFKGKLLCGFAKYPGQLKKDGTKMWACPFKFKFDYFILKDKQGKIIKTSFKQEELDNKKGTITKELYPGCPRWNKENPLDNLFNKKSKVTNKTKYANILDDF